MILQISTQFSLGMPSDDVARIQQTLQALERGVPVSETAILVPRAGTFAVLKRPQTEL